MANSVNWQTPANLWSNQSNQVKQSSQWTQLQTVGNSNKSNISGSTSNTTLFDNLLTTLVQEETALLQTESESATGMGLTAGFGGTASGTALYNGLGIGGIGSDGSNSSGLGAASAATGGALLPTDSATSLLSMLLESGLPAGIENASSPMTSNMTSGATIGNAPPSTAAGGASVNPATNKEISQAVSSAAKRYGLPVSLLNAVIHQESGFNPTATSKTGAMGLMQLMPATAQALGVQDPYSIQDNVNGGAKYLSQLLHQFNGDVSLALAGYNAGPSAVKHYGGVPPYSETQNYVQNILASLNANQAPAQL